MAGGVAPTVIALRVLTTAAAGGALLAELRSLLHRSFDDGFTEDDWRHALGGRHVVVVDGSDVVAHAALVHRVLQADGRPLRTGYVEAVATAPDRRHEGLASLTMAEVARLLHRDFELGALSTGTHELYERLGWERWRGPTFVRRRGGVVRTPDEDDGVMVLRFGASADLDLGLPLSCEERPGDDW
jgi:aminoglycoside 2'-N-acetyltransferase I